MTIPIERYNAVLNTEKFLISLLQPSETPRVPKAIRKRAGQLLKHYPHQFDLDRVIEGEKDVFAKNYNVI